MARERDQRALTGLGAPRPAPGRLPRSRAAARSGPRLDGSAAAGPWPSRAPGPVDEPRQGPVAGSTAAPPPVRGRAAPHGSPDRRPQPDPRPIARRIRPGSPVRRTHGTNTCAAFRWPLAVGARRSWHPTTAPLAAGGRLGAGCWRLAAVCRRWAAGDRLLAASDGRRAAGGGLHAAGRPRATSGPRTPEAPSSRSAELAEGRAPGTTEPRRRG
ncbi:hypothetical protein FB464_2152 [Subtercola boreus]|nr:hypothetical protein FB464_2152 [Subtercola boreus]